MLPTGGGVAFVVGSVVARWLPSLSLAWVIVVGLGVWGLEAKLGRRRSVHEARRQERESAELEEKIKTAALRRLTLTEREKALLGELESRTWLDAIAIKVYARYERDISRWLGYDILDPALARLCPLGPIESMRFRRFELGPSPPRLIRVKPSHLVCADEVELDLEIEHLGAKPRVELVARLNRIPLTLECHSLSFAATLKVRVRMSDRSPFIGQLDIAFSEPPKVLDFHLGLLSSALDVTGVPEVGGLITQAVRNCLDNLMVWPHRISLPLEAWFYPTSIPPTVAHGVLRLAVDLATSLPAADFDGFSDPYVVVTVSGKRNNDDDADYEVRDTFRTAVKSKTLFPAWRETFSALCVDPARDRVRFEVWDHDMFGEHDALGTAEVPADILLDLGSRSRTRAIWLRLDEPPKPNKLRRRDKTIPSRLRIELSYGVLRPSKSSFRAFDDVFDAAEVLVAADDDDDDFSPSSPPSSESSSSKEVVSHQVLARDELRDLHRRGATTLRTGYVKKDGGLRPWRRRWLELELCLEFGPTRALSATLRFFRDSEKFVAHSELRLTSKDSVDLAGSGFEVRQPSTRGVKIRAPEDAAAWVAEIDRALRAIKLDVAPHPSGREPDQRTVTTGATIVVEIFQARGLVAPEDLCDPFVVATLGGGQTFKTRTVRRDLNPKWCEHAEFWGGYLSSETTTSLFGGFSTLKDALTITVYDEDVGAPAHDVLGSLHLPLAPLVQPLLSSRHRHHHHHHQHQHQQHQHQHSPAENNNHHRRAPPRPQWYTLSPPSSHQPHHHHKKHQHRHRHGEILLRITPRIATVAKLDSKHRLALSAKGR
ncbi:hypothetical protein CTAYLR_001660 [Chrysophaeum taylorii]|uniref:Uncharacterized protein n=1 Tax=Chrysophaeum taylorii TaxID=2483200 RepID=A0AAD7XL23_9STRA|nr:hypothetical protein CTAYLR_001660 [Chrysophaeum taylorii]